MSLANKRQAVRDYKREHPSATYSEIGKALGCSYSTISDALRSPSAEESVLDRVAAHPSPPLTTGVRACPKTSAYLEKQFAWAVKHKRSYEAWYLSECLKEMEALL